MDGDGNGQEFGIKCVAGVSINESTTDLIESQLQQENLLEHWVALLAQLSKLELTAQH